MILNHRLIKAGKHFLLRDIHVTANFYLDKPNFFILR